MSLIPNNIERLTKIHLEIAEIINVPLNAAFSNYDPHLTLFNSYAETACMYFNEVSRLTPPLEARFTIALGLIDDVGQITGVIIEFIFFR